MAKDTSRVTPDADAKIDSEGALAALFARVDAFDAKLSSLSENLNKINSFFTSDMKDTDVGHDEQSKLQALAGGDLARVALQGFVFNELVSQRQVLRSVEDSMDNRRNQQAQNNATTLHGIDGLQNVDTATRVDNEG